MPKIFWTGKLSFTMMLVVNANNILAWIIGDIRDTAAMKDRVKQGYEGSVSDHVGGYDELGMDFQVKAASAQLAGVDLQGKEVLDVGGGTGIISMQALEKGAAKVVCGDISSFMLEMAKAKAISRGYTDRMEFRRLDAESLPFADCSFDLVMSGMTFGILPNAEKALKEMVRVLRPGGFLSLSAHGPEHYWEPCDASFRCINKRYVLGYRLEYWPRSEENVRQLLLRAGLKDIKIKRCKWRNTFRNGGEAYDFFTAITSSWWFAKVPPSKREKEHKRMKNYFDKKNVNTITDDVVIAYARKA